MTREEEINIKLKEHFARGWKGSVLDAFKEGVKWTDKTMIDKACEWLLKGGYFVNSNETIEDFRKPMEE